MHARSVDGVRRWRVSIERDVIAGPFLDHRDDVEGVAYVTKLLHTDEPLSTESGQRRERENNVSVEKPLVHTPRRSTARLVISRGIYRRARAKAAPCGQVMGSHSETLLDHS